MPESEIAIRALTQSQTNTRVEGKVIAIADGDTLTDDKAGASQGAKDVNQISLKKALAWAGVLVGVDAFLFNQGGIAALVGLWMLFVSLPRAAFVKDPEQRRRRLLRAAIFLGAVLLVFGLNWANNQIARNRAETLVAAIKAFNQKNHHYPAKLDELVPDFINHVPSAKYAVISASFYYYPSRENKDAILFYMALPPFGRPTYDFGRDRWVYID